MNRLFCRTKGIGEADLEQKLSQTMVVFHISLIINKFIVILDCF